MSVQETRVNFDFAMLERAIEEYWPTASVIGLTRIEKWSFFGTIAGAVIGIGAITFIKNEYGIYIALLGLVIELVSFLVGLKHFVKTELPAMRRIGPDLASGLDSAFPRYTKLLAELRKVPARDLDARLDFLRHRVSISNQRMDFLIGSFEKLGVFPALAGLMLQVRAVLLTDSKQSMVGYVLGSTVIAIYLISLWASRLKHRQAFYLDVLERAAMENSHALSPTSKDSAKAVL